MNTLPFENVPAMYSNDRSPTKTSDHYSLFRTHNIADILSERGWYPVEAKQVRAADPNDAAYKRHLVVFGNDDPSYNDGDNGKFRLVMYNSHDATTSLKMWAGYFRAACLNMCIMGSQVAQLIIKHINFTPDDLAKFVSGFTDTAVNVKDHIERFRAVNLSDFDRTDFAHNAMTIKYGEKQPPFSEQMLLVTRRNTDAPRDLWTTYNVVQENLIKGGIAYKPFSDKMQSQKTRAIRTPAEIVRINQGLWDLAGNYAKAA